MTTPTNELPCLQDTLDAHSYVIQCEALIARYREALEAIEQLFRFSMVDGRNVKEIVTKALHS